MFSNRRLTITLAILLIAIPPAASALTEQEKTTLILQLVQKVLDLQQQIATLGGAPIAIPPGFATLAQGNAGTTRVAASSCMIERTLALGTRGEDVKCLQTYLISQNLLASDNATGYFGPLTEAAVQRFQTARSIVSSGTPQTTGFGLVGRLTRVAIAAARPPVASENQEGSGGSETNSAPVGAFSPPAGTSSQTACLLCSTFIDGEDDETDCSLDGIVVPNGTSRTFYSTSIVIYPATCASVSQVRTCSYGTLSGSPTYNMASCAVKDATPPSVPANLTATAVSSAQINLSWTASIDQGGAGLAGYKIYRNNTQIATTTTASFQNTGLTASTAYTYQVASYDKAGNVSAKSASVTKATLAVPSDTTPPTVSITTPTNGATVSGTTNITANASDNVGVAGVQFKLDGANIGAEDTTAPYTTTWNTTTAANGTHTIQAVARDAAGNRVTSTISARVDNVAPPPAMTIKADAATLVVGQSTVIRATFTSGAGDALADTAINELPPNGTEFNAIYSGAIWNTPAKPSHDFTFTPKTAGTYVFKPYVITKNYPSWRGVSAGQWVTVVVNNVAPPPADTTPPTVSLTAPAANTTVSGAFTVSANASDNVGVAGVQFKLDGTNLGAEDTVSPYTTSWNTTVSGNGTHTLTVVARDIAGNRATSTIKVMVANPTGFHCYFTNGIRICHNAANEAVYSSIPNDKVAYNVSTVRDGSTYYTVYHSEHKGAVAPEGGDSIQSGVTTGTYTGLMPAHDFRLWGNDNPNSLLAWHSIDAAGKRVSGPGGGGNPIIISGLPGDPYFYVFFLGVADDDRDRLRAENDWRHYLIQARTQDFITYDLKTDSGWEPFSTATADTVRPAILTDAAGAALRSNAPKALGSTQGLIGSISYVGGTYHFFYGDYTPDGASYNIYHRTTTNLATGQWSLPEVLFARGTDPKNRTMVRIAKAEGLDRWLVLYGCYVTMLDGTQRQDMCLQYTQNLTVVGAGGLSSLSLTPEFALGFSDLASRSLAQPNLLTDRWGNQTHVNDATNTGEFYWSDYHPGQCSADPRPGCPVYGGDVLRGGWNVKVI